MGNFLREGNATGPARMPVDVTKQILIRPAVNGDTGRLGELGALLMSMHHDIDPRRFIPISRHTSALYSNYLRDQLAQTNVLLLVAEIGQDLAGYIFARSEGPDYMALRGPAGVIHDLIVDPRWRRQGAGRLLLKSAVEGLRGRGLDKIVLSTAFQNASAQKLFASEGFNPTMIEMTRES